MVIFLDTYAIIEIACGNPCYKIYTLELNAGITTTFNILELYFYYLKNFGNPEADKIYSVVKQLVVPIDDFLIKKASEFKLANLKKRFSFADCVGYITALEYGAKFLTGDYAFKNFENVEFVK